MKIIDQCKRSVRNLKSAKLRTFLTALAISIGGFTLCITLAASTGARQYTDRLISANFDPNSLFVVKDESFFGAEQAGPREYSEDLGSAFGTTLKLFDQNDVDTIKALPNVQQVIKSYALPLQYITREGQSRFTGVINIFNPSQKPQIISGSLPASMAVDQVLLPDDYLDPLGFSNADDAIGKSVLIQLQRPTGEIITKELTVLAVTTRSNLSVEFAEVGPYISENLAEELNDFITAGTIAAGKVPSLVLVTDGTINPQQMRENIEAVGYEARTAEDLQSLINQVIAILQGIIIVFGLITLIASFFGVVNTQYISVLERTREIGLMKALGASSRAITGIFVVEATLIGFIGAALGCITAIVAGVALNPLVSDAIDFGDEKLLVFQAEQVVLLILFLMGVTMVAGLLPAIKAAKLDPIIALRTE